MKFREKVLVVDHDSTVRESLVSLLESQEIAVTPARDAAEAMSILDTEFIALVIIDTHLPKTGGFALMDYVQASHPGVDCVVTTAYNDFEIAQKAMEKGAYDFVVKPFHSYSMLMSVQRAMEKRRLALENREFQTNLEKKMKEQLLSLRLRNEEKQNLINNTINSLVHTLEAKDKYTEGHSRRVADTALAVAKRLGLSPRDQEELHLAGLFHDIGKIGVRESVLHKEGKLTPEEYEIIKEHVVIGVKILEQIPQFRRISMIVRHHHEFYDGSGYPDGLAGADIPLGGRILAVCDAYDAMTSDRPYRRALSDEDACRIIIRNAGRQFDPDLVDVFLRAIGVEKEKAS